MRSKAAYFTLFQLSDHGVANGTGHSSTVTAPGLPAYLRHAVHPTKGHPLEEGDSRHPRFHLRLTPFPGQRRVSREDQEFSKGGQ